MLNKRFLTIIIFVSAIFISGSTAYVANDIKIEYLHAPMAPIKGRKSEINFYSMLSNSDREYKSWIVDGKKYLKRREFEQAIWAFRKSIKLQPANEEARFLVAWAYEKRGLERLPGDSTNWDNLAIREYLAAIELADHLPSRFNLAILYKRLNQSTKARNHLEYILLIQPRSSLGKRAEKELKILFAQHVRPQSISSKIRSYK